MAIRLAGIRITDALRKLGVAQTINSQDITVFEYDADGLVATGEFAGTITDGGAGYAVGALMTDTSTGKIAENQGTTSSCAFNVISEVDESDMASGYGLVVAGEDALTTTGGDAAEVVSVTGVATGDVVTWSILDNGTNSVTGVSAVAGTDQITFTFSGDPSSDTIISYMVSRIAS